MPQYVDLKDETELEPVDRDWGMCCPHDRNVLVAFRDGVRCPGCDRFWSYLNPVRFYAQETAS